MRATTQLDVAKAAGVSQRAVAAVVGRGAGRSDSRVRVSEVKRKLILEVAARLNYQPHRQAQLMRGVRSMTIGVIKRVGVAQYHLEKSFYVIRAIEAAGYSPMVSEHWEDHAFERSVEMLLGAKVEGVILIGFNHESMSKPLERFHHLGIPTVALPGGGLSMFPCVVTDHAKGMQEVVRHLVGQGMRRLVYGCPKIDAKVEPHYVETHRRRLDGFLRGADEAGIRGECQVIEVPWREKKNRDRPFEIGGSFDYFYPGVLLAERVLEMRKLPEALVCCNDNWALGALRRLRHAGIEVPAQMAITGFDGEIVNAYTLPSLTTVIQQGQLIAEEGVRMLVEMIGSERKQKGRRVVRIPGRLVVRESSFRNGIVPNKNRYQ